MGERLINPIHNIFKQYRKMNLVNPYLSASTPFVSTWNTENLSTGSSLTKQVKLPLIVTGTYNMSVDWGDGTKSTITAWNQAAVTHTYSVAGLYIISIVGTCIGWGFNNTLDRLKIISVQSWGQLKLNNSVGSFYGCANLNLSSVTDTLDLTGSTNLNNAFNGCTALTTINRLNEWNMGSITSIGAMFTSTPNFNQNIGNWNVSNIGSFADTFNGSGFNNGGSADINNWTLNTTATVDMTRMFALNTKFNQPIGNWNTVAVITMPQIFQGASIFNQNISSWNTINVTSMNSMFLNAIAFNNELASGVAGTLSLNTTNVTNMGSMFQNAASFNQNIGGFNVSKVADFGNMFLTATKFNNGGSTSINTWVLKTTGTIFMNAMFQSATIFNQPIGNWNVSRVTIMSSMFQSAITFNQDLSSWDTSSSTTMQAMFNGTTAFNNGLATGVVGNMLWNTTNVTTTANMFTSCVNFNQNLGALNLSNCSSFTSMFITASKFNNGGSLDINNWTLNTTSNVTMSSMFSGAVLFNSNIGGWNVSKVTDTSSMFSSAWAFNNGGNTSINGWNTSSVTNMSNMFDNCTFNQPIGSWNTSLVTNMSQMFRKPSFAGAFNQNISSWNVSKVTNFIAMFQGSSTFNNGLSSGVAGVMNWTFSTISAISMQSMFNGNAAFNQNIGLWNVQNVIDFSKMFSSALTFNNGGSYSINGWNTSGVTNMSRMFGNEGYPSCAFNQPIGNWNTSSVTDMSYMFGNPSVTGQTIFNQNIGLWNISKVTNFTGFMNKKTPATFSAANLDAIYNGWSSRPVKTPITITFGTAKYTSAGSAGRAILTGAPNLWTIADGGI